jgi:hypothetical protein
MKYFLALMAVPLAFALIVASCSDVTGVDGSISTRTVTYVMTGPMRTVQAFGYYTGGDTSPVIEDCMVPFHVTVEFVPDEHPVAMWATKHTPDGHLTLMAIEDGVVIGYAEALDGELQAMWIEGQ